MVTVNKILKNLLPPIFLKVVRKFKNQSVSQETIKRYNNYQEAFAECTKDGYEDDELVRVILEKTRAYKTHLNSIETLQISNIIAFSSLSIINLIAAKKTTINVIDFGGACGAHYFELKRLLENKILINWIVVETPAMVKYAKELETEELRFVSSIEEAKSLYSNFDLIYSSGALQCVDNPNLYLQKLLNIKAEYIYFSRLGMNKMDRDVITIHSSDLSGNGIGKLPEKFINKVVRYPFTFFSEQSFLFELSKGYKCFMKFDDNTGFYQVPNEQIIGYGLLCKRIN
ncbi:MAG: methyltransferase, TIGR04325 family [Bacteroidetes bacterium]|nr:methyltransferase, TIGR04325 family [Bacteroidota bacterium]